jgi:hypothetical protein
MSLFLPIFFLGVLASLSPSTIIVFILLLATTRARVNAVAFLVGWTVSLTIVFAIGYFIGADHSLQHGGGHTALDLIEILAGLALVYAAAIRWHRRHRPRTGSGLPKSVSSRLQALNPWEATVLGVLMQPWTLTLAAAIVVVRHHLGGIVVVVAFLAFTVISTATVGVTFWYYSRHPGDAETRLSELRERVVNAGPALFAIVSLMVGTYLIVDGFIDLIH